MIQSMRKIVVPMLCVAACLSSGCLPVFVGGMFYHDAKKKQTRQSFMADFRNTNLEREKNGLEPLDLCTEKYHFDRSWAREDRECRERIKLYEAGEHSALGMPKKP